MDTNIKMLNRGAKIIKSVRMVLKNLYSLRKIAYFAPCFVAYPEKAAENDAFRQRYEAVI